MTGTTCPVCGGPKKKPESKTCRPCDYAARAESGKRARTCPTCGQYKHIRATVCADCYRANCATGAAGSKTCDCGNPKALQAKMCRPCRNEVSRPPKRLCTGCGAEKTWKNATGLCASCYRANKAEEAARRRVCECGSPKKATSKTCIGCRIAFLTASTDTSPICGCGRTKDRRSAKCAECHTPTRVCPKCGGPKGTDSKQCGTCRRDEERRDFEQIAEDVEWLIESREWPVRICQRLGQRRDTLVRRLQNNGRHDLASYLDAVHPEEARRSA